jgi:hypothetical protein
LERPPIQGRVFRREYTFPPRESAGGGIAFSDDSSGLAFTMYPKTKEAKKLKKQKKKPFNKAGLADLFTGKLIAFEGIPHLDPEKHLEEQSKKEREGKGS